MAGILLDLKSADGFKWGTILLEDGKVLVDVDGHRLLRADLPALPGKCLRCQHSTEFCGKCGFNLIDNLPTTL